MSIRDSEQETLLGGSVEEASTPENIRFPIDKLVDIYLRSAVRYSIRVTTLSFRILDRAILPYLFLITLKLRL